MAAAGVYVRPLKKPRLGPPDVFLQVAKQREDDLSETSVKRGFANPPAISNEFGSAKELFSSFNLSKFAVQYNGIQLQKEKNNSFLDNTQKKLQVNKENFWMVTPRSKPQVMAWLGDLAKTKSLSILGKKVPIFNKKEDIFSSLCEHNVPMNRAAWFLKVTSSYQNTISESKMKKRASTDPSQEWTCVLTKYMKDQLNRLVESYGQPYASVVHQRPSADVELALKQWNYSMRLSDWLMEENLLDKQEFLKWLIELMERLKNRDDALIRHILPLILKHLNSITSTQTLSRSLSTCCIRKLTLLNIEAEQMQGDANVADKDGTNGEARPMSPMRNTSPVLSALDEYKECEQHRSLVVILCGIIQAITLCCPTALVWSAAKIILNPSSSQSGGDVRTSVLGSPLDRLQCAPSALLSHVSKELSIDTDEREDFLMTRINLQTAEEKIQERGRAAERQWLSSTHQESETVGKTLAILDVLDRSDFFKTDSAIPLQSIYKKIFPVTAKELTKCQQEEDRTNVLLLCDWAVTDRRHGIHRALVCVRLLLQRQNEMNDEGDEQGADDTPDDRIIIQPFQNCLMEFLDKQAVIYGEQTDVVNLPSFKQLVFLFGEFIRWDVFSHNKYMYMLIARGDIGNIINLKDDLNQQQENSNSDGIHFNAMKSQNNDRQTSLSDPSFNINYETTLDEDLLHEEHDLQKLLNADKDLSGFFVTLPPSTKSSVTDDSQSMSGRTSVAVDLSKRKAAGHQIFALHFPLPPSECDVSHESKQRSILLFGVGKRRKEALKHAKEISKEAADLLLVIDVVGTLVDQHDSQLNAIQQEKKREYIKKVEQFFKNFIGASTYDQYNITSRCYGILTALRDAKPSEYNVMSPVPSIYQLAFLINLYELSGDIEGLLEFVSDLLQSKEMGYAGGLVPQSSSVQGTLPPKLLLVVSIIYRYYACLLTSPELTSIIFRGSLQTVENIADPAVCTSTERAVLKLLYNLYTSCEGLRGRFADIFSTAYTKIGQTIGTTTMPSNSSLLWESSVLSEYVANPRHQQLDPIWQTHLSSERPAELYSFVCSVIMEICRTNEAEQVYDVAVLCAETTSHISALANEWLGIVKALCCCGNSTLGFNDLVNSINITESTVFNSLSILVCVLISRCCFTLADFLKHVALPSLQAGLSCGDEDTAKNGAKLTCHILLKLFDETISHPLSMFTGGLTSVPFCSTSDHGLLTGALDNAELESVLPILKLLLVLSNTDPKQGSNKMSSMSTNGSTSNVNDEIFLSLVNMNSSDYLENSSSSTNLLSANPTPASTLSDLRSLASHVLCISCCQRWIQLKFLQRAEKLLTRDMLLDPYLKVRMARQIIRLCSSSDVDNLSTTLDNDDFEAVTNRLCENLDHWSLQSCYLELQLMILQASKEDISRLLNAVARSVMSSLLGTSKSASLQSIPKTTQDAVNDRHTLIGPLIAKLPVTVQGRILKAAAEKMERGKWWNEKDSAKITHESQQSMFTLILSCLRGQDDNKNVFLNSLHTQLSNFCNAPSKEKFPTSANGQSFLLEALHLRLNLVGAMFDIIQKASQSIYEWTVTLFRLAVCGVVVEGATAPFDSMFTDLLDMIVVLLNTVQLNDNHATQIQSGSDLQKYGTLVRRLRKELVNRPGTNSIKQCEQLLPIGSPLESIITTESLRTPDVPVGGSSTPLNKHGTDEDQDEPTSGLKITGVQTTSPWDLLEGHKNPAPLSWAAFGAVRIERKPLKYLEQARSLVHHTHQKRMPFSYYAAEPYSDEADGRLTNPTTPVTPFFSPSATSPGGSGALAQLLASVRGNSISSPRELEVMKQLSGQRPSTPDGGPMQSKEVPQKRKRQSRQGTPQGNQNVANVTQAQLQQKQQMLMLLQQQQQQQQQQSLSRSNSISRTTTPETVNTPLQVLLKGRSGTPVSMHQQGVMTLDSSNPMSQLQQQLARQQAENFAVSSDHVLHVASSGLQTSSGLPLEFSSTAPGKIYQVNSSAPNAASFDFLQQQQQQFSISNNQIQESNLHQLLQGRAVPASQPQTKQNQPRFQHQLAPMQRSMAQAQSIQQALQRGGAVMQRQLSSGGGNPRLQSASSDIMVGAYQRQLSAGHAVTSQHQASDLQALQQRSRPSSATDFRSASGLTQFQQQQHFP